MRLLGSDLDYSPSLLLLSALIYLGTTASLFYYTYENVSGAFFFAICSTYLLVLGAVSYTIGALLLVGMNIEKIFSKLDAIKIEKLSYLRRYYNGNPLLIVSWLFYFPTMLYFIIPLLAYEAGYITASVLFGCLILLVVVLAITFFLVLSATTESLKMNSYKGSSYFLDIFCCGEAVLGMFGGSENTAWIKAVLGNDFVVGLIVFSLIGIGASIFLWLLVLYKPSDISLWLLAIASLLFSLGMAVFAREYSLIVNNFEVTVSPNERTPLVDNLTAEESVDDLTGENEEKKGHK